MDCPKCRNSHHVKDGIIRGKQRYRCKGCRYRYTVERKSDVKTPVTKRLALAMYLEGFGFRFIGRILKISYGTVYAWVKQWSAHVCFPRRERPAEAVGLKELLAYVESKKTVGRHSLLLIDLEKEIALFSTDSSLKQRIITNMENLS
jgi:transposase-like protein